MLLYGSYLVLEIEIDTIQNVPLLCRCPSRQLRDFCLILMSGLWQALVAAQLVQFVKILRSDPSGNRIKKV